jgi:hypothetical protein
LEQTERAQHKNTQSHNSKPSELHERAAKRCLQVTTYDDHFHTYQLIEGGVEQFEVAQLRDGGRQRAEAIARHREMLKERETTELTGERLESMAFQVQALQGEKRGNLGRELGEVKVERWRGRDAQLLDHRQSERRESR